MDTFTLWRSNIVAMLHDLLWIPLAIGGAFWLRFNLETIPDAQLPACYALITLALPVQFLSFYAFGLYRGIWRFASLPDLMRIVRAVAVGCLVSFALLFLWSRVEGLPRSVFFLYPLILILGLAVPRMLYRWIKDRHLNFSRVERKRALIVGAGQAGELLVRDLLKTGPYEPIGFLDDAARRQGQEIHGVRVLGRLDDLVRVIQHRGVEVVLLAMPSAAHAVIQGVVQQCQGLSVVCRTLPSVSELADGRVEVSRLRQVEIEDLLGRDAIMIDRQRVNDLIQGQVVMVTGAGGSIGSELCRQLLLYHPSVLVMVDHGEYNLYQIEMELLKQNQSDSDVYARLGDIRDQLRMSIIIDQFKPVVIFNAAAYNKLLAT
ncbi:MAG: polysaccharide biosynthesis protein [Zetaproteobacteria bacterium]|nr:polysaccharide biosynthesis protein [Zetaproteobacteria bacterium]